MSSNSNFNGNFQKIQEIKCERLEESSQLFKIIRLKPFGKRRAPFVSFVYLPSAEEHHLKNAKS